MDIKISASILSADLLHLEDEVRRVEAAGTDMLHYDVMDSVFVPNISFGLPVLQAVSGATDLFLDVHLMMRDPLRYIQDFAKAGADMITFHLESASDPFQTIAAIHDCGLKAGIALKPATPARAVLPFLDDVENILVMTVEPGFGGQRYLHEMDQKIARIRSLLEGRRVYLQVDGGINGETTAEAVRAGADLLVAGSYLFGMDDMGKGIAEMRAAAGRTS